MSQQLMDIVEQPYLKAAVPEFRVGDTVDVLCRIIEGEKQRILTEGLDRQDPARVDPQNQGQRPARDPRDDISGAHAQPAQGESRRLAPRRPAGRRFVRIAGRCFGLVAHGQRLPDPSAITLDPTQERPSGIVSGGVRIR